MKCIVKINFTRFSFLLWLLGSPKLHLWLCYIFTGAKVRGTWQDTPGKDRPVSLLRCHKRDLSERAKRHEPLQSYKFIGLEINTNISLRNSSGKTCTQQFPVSIQLLLPWPLTSLRKVTGSLSGVGGRSTETLPLELPRRRNYFLLPSSWFTMCPSLWSNVL